MNRMTNQAEQDQMLALGRELMNLVDQFVGPLAPRETPAHTMALNEALAAGQLAIGGLDARHGLELRAVILAGMGVAIGSCIGQHDEMAQRLLLDHVMKGMAEGVGRASRAIEPAGRA